MSKVEPTELSNPDGEPICPFCKHEHENQVDAENIMFEKDGRYKCEACGKEFYLLIENTIIYHSYQEKPEWLKL